MAAANDVSGIASGTVLSDISSPLLAQTTLSDVERRGQVALQDFVPNAQTLAATTRYWEDYLNQVFVFVRGRR